MSAEVKKVYSGYVDFNAYSRDLTVPFVLTDEDDLVDIELTFYTMPTVDPLAPSFGLVGGEDYRIYINYHDVTASVVKRLKTIVKAIPAQQMKEQYLAGAERYIKLVRSLGTHSNETKDDESHATLLSNTSDWSQEFERLGDRKVGWSGNLHPVSFIYRHIDLPPISLEKVWSDYAEENEDAPSTRLSDLPFRTITFSQGPSPLDEAFDPSAQILGGRLIYQLEAQYVNPLKRPLERILTRQKEIAKDMETLRTQYLEPSLTGIERVDQDVDRMEQSLNERLRQLTETVGNISR